MSPNRVVVRLRPGSDADPTHVPKQDHYTQINPPTIYLEKIADQWMASQGQARAGVKYVLEGLPAGYTLWQRPRGSNSQHFDKYLYGHPNQKPFDSPNRFYPHFEYIMANGGNSIGCPCTVCSGNAGILPRASPNSSRMRSSSVALRQSTASNISVPMRNRPSDVASTDRQVPASNFYHALANYRSVTRVPRSPIVTLPGPVTHRPTTHKGRPKSISAGLDTSAVDLEGTPDVYRNLSNKLRRHGYLDEVITEPLSPDWRAEQEFLPELLAGLKMKEQWVPRKGDIVLYIRDLPKGIELVRHDVTDELQLYDEEKGEFDTPEWRAGLVTESATGTTLADILDEDVGMNVSRSGVRVEPVPNPNSSDKSMSKQHKYVSLRQTCPFVYWQELLKNVPDEKWHLSIKNALTSSATLALMGRYRFRGTWPNAHIYCHGMHLGSELLVIGDTVRIMPHTRSLQQECTDILVIKSIRLKFLGMDKASNNDYDEGQPYTSEVWVYGSAYTSDPSRSNKQWLSDSNVEPPKVASGYADLEWHPLHPPDKELAVNYVRVFGRLHERDALAFFLKTGSEKLLGLDVGQKAVLDARKFSREHNERITQELNTTWYWADNRSDALGLHTVNGLEVSAFDPDRDIKDLRKKYRVLDGMTNGQPHDGKARPQGLRGFVASTKALSRAQSESSTSASSDGQRSTISKKRAHHVTDLTDSEDDDINDGIKDEIRQHTRVIEEHEPTAKKARVNVVIGRAAPA